MENILELFYDSSRKVHEQDSSFVRMARIKSENLDMLNATLTDKQKELWEAYVDADAKIEAMMGFNRFRYAFHLGAQLMAEMMKGKEELLE